MKRLLKALAVALLGFYMLVCPVLAISNPDANPTIYSQRVFQNVFVNNDMLIVCYYNVPYAVLPTEPASESFIYSLYGTNGTTLLYNRPLNYYNENVISIYLNATQAAALTWESAYVLKLSGNPAMFATINAANSASVALSPADWIAGTYTQTATLLQAYLTTVMETIDANGTDVMTVTADGNVLNTLGRTYFLAAIPGLDSRIPEMFQLSSSDITVIHDTPTGALAAELTIANKLGAQLGATFTSLGTWLGITPTMAGGLFMMALCGLVAFLVFKYSGNTIAAMVICVPFLIAGSWSGLVPLALLYTLGLLVVMYVGYHLWLRI